jgi:hypothetical protein
MLDKATISEFTKLYIYYLMEEHYKETIPTTSSEETIVK